MGILKTIFLRLAPHRLRSIEGSSAADMAAEMLCAPSALLQLSHEEARTIVAYMQPHRIREGVTFIREGDTADTGFMLLVLDGEVTVESIVVSRTTPVTVRVLGPGSMHGDVGLLDGVVDRRMDSREFVEVALDPGRA